MFFAANMMTGAAIRKVGGETPPVDALRSTESA